MINPGRLPFEPRRRTAGLCLVLGLAVSTGTAVAHDVWLEPTTFRPRPGETVGIDVQVGEAFKGESVPRRPSRIAGFWLGEGARREEVRGVDGASPAGLFRLAPEAEGWRTVLYVSRPASIELSPERFAGHLRQEGFSDLVERMPVDSRDPVREVYSRCSATLLLVPSGNNGLPSRPDCDLVLWTTTPPQSVGTLGFELTMSGNPVAGALVRAYPKSAGPGAPPVEGRTDERGTVTLQLPDSGVWLVKALQVEPPDASRTEWRSWWASLTFELSDR